MKEGADTESSTNQSSVMCFVVCHSPTPVLDKAMAIQPNESCLHKQPIMPPHVEELPHASYLSAKTTPEGKTPLVHHWINTLIFKHTE